MNYNMVLVPCLVDSDLYGVDTLCERVRSALCLC
jgi:hypothetical protein